MSISGAILKSVTKVSLALIEFIYPNKTRRGRRILFLSSFNAACVKAGVLDKNTLETLNRALSVAEDNNSLDVGFRMSPSIWAQHDIKEMFPISPAHQPVIDLSKADDPKFLTLTQAQSFTDNVLAQTPNWLRYDVDEMRNDVLDLVTENEVRAP